MGFAAMITKPEWFSYGCRVSYGVYSNDVGIAEAEAYYFGVRYFTTTKMTFTDT